MKRLLGVALVISGLVLPATLIDSAAAASKSLIFITAPSHREFNGLFIDDQLTFDLSTDGSIGSLLYGKKSSNIQWAVDPALVEEVIDMSDGYKLIDGTEGAGQDVAKEFLLRLSALAAVGRIDAMVYGNPSRYWVGRLTPHERNYILAASEKRLALLLKTNVGAPMNYVNVNYFSLPQSTVIILKDDYKTIENSAVYMDPLVLDNFRLSLTRLFNPQMSSMTRSTLLEDFDGEILKLRNSIRLAPGRFTITSASQKLPITIINDFPNVAKVKLAINSLNEKVLVGNIDGVEVAGKSKVQVLVPVKVLTSGSSGLNISIINPKGGQIGDSQIYSLSLKVISPIATWITTAAAVTLFVAALLQSLRRIRRRRSHE